MKIYLDTNILSNIVGGINRLTKDQGIALQKIAESNNEFITSPLMKQEMKKTPNQQVKGAILFIYKIFGGTKNLNTETYVATGVGDALFGAVPFGGGETEIVDLLLLRQAFDEDDARHIFQAISSSADYYLTFDEKSLLRKYRQNYMYMKDFCKKRKLIIVNPVELAEELWK